LRLDVPLELLPRRLVPVHAVLAQPARKVRGITCGLSERNTQSDSGVGVGLLDLHISVLCTWWTPTRARFPLLARRNSRVSKVSQKVLPANINEHVHRVVKHVATRGEHNKNSRKGRLSTSHPVQRTDLCRSSVMCEKCHA
jgi:hypothetical protein